jgi:hypothetical protein
MKQLLSLALIAGVLLGAGCKDKDSAESVGRDLDRAAEKTKDKLKEGADKTSDAIKDAGDKVKDASK